MSSKKFQLHSTLQHCVLLLATSETAPVSQEDTGTMMETATLPPNITVSDEQSQVEEVSPIITEPERDTPVVTIDDVNTRDASSLTGSIQHQDNEFVDAGTEMNKKVVIIIITTTTI